MSVPAIVRAFALGFAASTLLHACSQPLPEEGSPEAELYRAQCGTCHRAFQPSTMTASMWRYQYDRMEPKHRAAGTIITPADRDRILAYLERHAAR